MEFKRRINKKREEENWLSAPKTEKQPHMLFLMGETVDMHPKTPRKTAFGGWRMPHMPS
jgi:hypothetical protein